MTNELAELQPLAEKLNQKSNEINETIASFNAKLAAMNVGIEVWPECYHKNRGDYEIGYAKVEDGKTSSWMLAMRTCTAQKDENGFWVAEEGSEGYPESVLSASRTIRLETIAALPEILRWLKDETELSLKTIERAKQIVADL